MSEHFAYSERMNLLIVDDHKVVLEGVAALLAQSPLAPTILRALDVASALELVDQHDDLDVVLLDLRMPNRDGRSALRVLGERHPTIPVLVLSSSEDPEDVREAFALGALGYVAKSASPATLLGALQLVLAGEIYVPSFMAHSPRDAQRTSVGLTGRQEEVLDLVRAGMSNRAIAERLALSEKTVKAHMTSIFRTLGIASRSEVINVAKKT